MYIANSQMATGVVMVIRRKAEEYNEHRCHYMKYNIRPHIFVYWYTYICLYKLRLDTNA